MRWRMFCERGFVTGRGTVGWCRRKQVDASRRWSKSVRVSSREKFQSMDKLRAINHSKRRPDGNHGR